MRVSLYIDRRPITQHFTCLESAYVHQRYKEVHDLVHLLLEDQGNIELDSEVMVKYFEMVHYGLPVINNLYFPLYGLKNNNRVAPWVPCLELRF